MSGLSKLFLKKLIKMVEFTIGAVIKDVGSTEKTKTGGWRAQRPIVNKEKCTKCGTCWMYCPDCSIVIKDDGADVDYDYCKGCLICVNVCPVKCIKGVKEEK